MVLFEVFKKENTVVAHFNHKLRPSSDEDEEFVRRVCKENNIRLEVGELKIRPGEKISEERAREERYKFLNDVKTRLESEGLGPVKICTAHHLDDLVETVFINILRGTGWRGLAPFSAEIYRPFIQDEDVLKPESKADILTFAGRKKLNFRQDPTNYEPEYLRNRVRERLSVLDPDEKYELNQKMKKLYKRQTEIKTEISQIISEIIDLEEFKKQGIIQREWFYNLDETVGAEILRVLLEARGISLTGPKMKEFLAAIKNYNPEKKFNLPGDKLVTIHKNYLKI